MESNRITYRHTEPYAVFHFAELHILLVTPMCPLEPISCPAGWQFDAQGHDKQNHGDDNYKWPHACEKCGRGALIKTTIPLNTPAEKGSDVFSDVC